MSMCGYVPSLSPIKPDCHSAREDEITSTPPRRNICFSIDQIYAPALGLWVYSKPNWNVISEAVYKVTEFNVCSTCKQNHNLNWQWHNRFGQVCTCTGCVHGQRPYVKFMSILEMLGCETILEWIKYSLPLSSTSMYTLWGPGPVLSLQCTSASWAPETEAGQQ